MKIQICREPDGQANIQPASIFLPAPRRDGVDSHEDVSLAELDRLPSIDQRRRRSVLREVHRDGVDLRLLAIVSRRDCADDSEEERAACKRGSRGV